MAIDKGKIKIEGETGRMIHIGFSYKEGGKTYEGVLTIMTMEVGDIPEYDYEVEWEGEAPPGYDPDTDDEKIYQAYVSRKRNI